MHLGEGLRGAVQAYSFTPDSCTFDAAKAHRRCRHHEVEKSLAGPGGGRILRLEVSSREAAWLSDHTLLALSPMPQSDRSYP